jgi:hypothetical protein
MPSAMDISIHRQEWAVLPLHDLLRRNFVGDPRPLHIMGEMTVPPVPAPEAKISVTTPAAQSQFTAAFRDGTQLV